METRMDSASAAPKADAVASERSDSLKKRFRPFDTVIAAILTACGIVSIFTTIGIVVILGEQTLGFFDAQAFVTRRAPVVDGPAATLIESLDEGETSLTIDYEGERHPFADGQFIQIDNEIMQITSRSRNAISVERGADGTTPETHDGEIEILAMNEEQILSTEPLDLESTVLPLEEGQNFGREFSVGEIIRMGNEEMRITAVEPDQLEVERGVNGTAPRLHPTTDLITVPRETSLVGFLTGTEWRPTIGEFGVLPLLVATLEISAIALLVALPMGLGAAIYLSEYASPRVRGILKPILEILAGIPTVVYGFFALTFMSPLLRAIFGEQVQFQNMLSAGLVVGILIIPYISSLSEDALSAVPRALREASYGLGATKLETTVRVVLPAATSGVVAAIIIAASRAIGETMIVTMAAGSLPNLTVNIFSGAETITGNIARVSGGDLPFTSITYKSIFAIGSALFLMTLTLNMLSTFIIRRFREAY